MRNATTLEPPTPPRSSHSLARLTARLIFIHLPPTCHLLPFLLRLTWQADRQGVDDPLLTLLSRLFSSCFPLMRREKGVFIMPEGTADEPHRTEMALAEAFDCAPLELLWP